MWKDEFNKLYFGETNHERDIIGALSLKHENFPKSLFKYTKAEHAISSFSNENNYIKVSIASEANDPFEGDLFFDYGLLSSSYKEDLLIKQLNNPIFNLTKDDKEIIFNDNNPLEKLIEILYINKFGGSEGLTFEEFKKRFKEVYSEFEHYSVINFNNELKKQIIFVSLSESNNIVPLWAHYADDHKGVCIEYDLSLNDFPFEEPCFPINYVEHADYTEEINQLHNDNRNKLKILEEPFLKKSIDWSYEKEWRVLIDKTRLKSTINILHDSKIIKNEGKLCFIKFPKPTSVFLGLKISKEDEIKIKEICHKRDINVYKMVKDESEYNLNYVKI